MFLVPSAAPHQSGIWVFGAGEWVTLWLGNKEATDQHMQVLVRIPVLHPEPDPWHRVWFSLALMVVMLSTSELKLMV